MLLTFSTMLIAVPMTRCEGEDPIHVWYPAIGGSVISTSPGPIVWTGPCTTESFDITVRIKWDSPPVPPKKDLDDPTKWVSWVTVQMAEVSSYGMTFVPLGTTLYNPEQSFVTGPDYCDVVVTVPVAGLPAGTYAANIKVAVTSQGPAQSPTVSGTNGYFQFVKEVCVPPEEYFDLVVQTDPLGIVEIPGSGTYLKCTYVDLTAPAFVPSEEGEDGFRYRFDYWDVDTITVSGNPITVHMDAAHTATAHYVEQYYLTVKTDPEGLVEIAGEGWYDKCTHVDLTAPPAEGYLFVYWDVDGTAVEGNPITVHMDAAHAATAYYWPELEYTQFVTDSSFNVIERFDTVWTPKDQKKTMFKLASTNPGQFYLNIEIINTWAVNTGPITVSYTLDPDFIIHPILGDPIQVWTGYGITGTRIPATVTYGASGTVTISGIAPGQAVYITIHMEYGPAREYFDKATMLDWKLHHASNTFYCGYTVTVPGPFPFDITRTTSTTIYDPIVVLGLED